VLLAAVATLASVVPAIGVPGSDDQQSASFARNDWPCPAESGDRIRNSAPRPEGVGMNLTPYLNFNGRCTEPFEF